MRKLAGESEPAIVVEDVIEPVEVRVALQPVPPRVRNMPVAPEGYVREVIQATAFRILSRLYLIRDHNPPTSRTEYLHFLKFCIHHSI